MRSHVATKAAHGEESGFCAPRMYKLTAENSSDQPCHPGKLPHILFVIDHLRGMGGAERNLLQIVRQLAPDRFRCSIVTFKVEQSFEVLKDLPCPLHVLPLRRTYDLNAAKMALRLSRLIRRENISIVHTFFETSDLWAAPIAKVSGCPLLVSSRRDMGIQRDWKHNLSYPVVNLLFDRVLAVSEGVRSYCLNHDHLPQQKVETLCNGVDSAEMLIKAGTGNARLHLGLCSGVPIISTVANIRPVKGIDILVRAAAHVCREFPEVIFLVVGRVLDAQMFADLQILIKSLQLAKNVRFLGPQSNPYPILKASDIFCLPSRSEGFSNALIEAMGCGLPCVATRVGGNVEAVDDGRNGYLVESEDADALADRMLRFLRDPLMARRMGKAARETVEKRFSTEAMVARLMDIYDELLADKNV